MFATFGLVHLGVAGTLWFAWLRQCSAIYAYSPPEGPPAYCTIFNHMVKSGGTTVKDQLFSSSQRDGQNRPGVCTSDGRTSGAECLNALTNSSVIMGYGELFRIPLQHVQRECTFFTMFRHPVDRLVSAFYYCPADHDLQRRPEKWCGDAELDVPATTRLVDFARNSWGNKAFVQMMYSLECPAWSYGGCGSHKVDVPAPNLYTARGQEALLQMKQLLDSYAAVGISEEWELSMQLFDATVPSPVRHWDPTILHNPGHESPRREEVLKWARASPEIHSILSADLLLYEHAVEVFRRQTTHHLGTAWNQQ